MNNEEKILSMLETLTSDVTEMKHKQSEMKHKQSEMESTLNAVFDHTANLSERQTTAELILKDWAATAQEKAADALKLMTAK